MNTHEARQDKGIQLVFLEVFLYLQACQTLHRSQPPSATEFIQRLRGLCACYAVWIIDCLFESWSYAVETVGPGSCRPTVLGVPRKEW